MAAEHAGSGQSNDAAPRDRDSHGLAWIHVTLVGKQVVSFGGYRIWYQTAGDLRSRAPIVLLHGAPGIPGNSSAQLMADLADSRPVVRYDQLGCGRSDRPNDSSLRRVETFLDKLAALRDALALDDIHLMGHSWGGMLAIE